MSTLEANIALLSTIPEENQNEIQRYLMANFCENSPYKSLGRGEILEELAESRKCYENGEREDLDAVIDEIEMKYGL